MRRRTSRLQTAKMEKCSVLNGFVKMRFLRCLLFECNSYSSDDIKLRKKIHSRIHKQLVGFREKTKQHSSLSSSPVAPSLWSPLAPSEEEPSFIGGSRCNWQSPLLSCTWSLCKNTCSCQKKVAQKDPFVFKAKITCFTNLPTGSGKYKALQKAMDES